MENIQNLMDYRKKLINYNFLTNKINEFKTYIYKLKNLKNLDTEEVNNLKLLLNNLYIRSL